MNRPDNILAYDEMDLKKKVPLIRATLNLFAPDTRRLT